MTTASATASAGSRNALGLNGSCWESSIQRTARRQLARRNADVAWSVNGDDGSWDYPTLTALLRDNFGSEADGTSFGPGRGSGLKVGDTLHTGTVCKADPSGVLPDTDDLLNHMFEAADGSDAGNGSTTTLTSTTRRQQLSGRRWSRCTLGRGET